MELNPIAMLRACLEENLHPSTRYFFIPPQPLLEGIHHVAQISFPASLPQSFRSLGC